MDPLFVYVTCKDDAEALAIGRAMVEERLAACANVLPGMRSLYWWEGKVVEDQECVLVLKSRADRFDELLQQVKALHSYSIPAVVALPIVRGNPDYLQWLREETTVWPDGR